MRLAEPDVYLIAGWNDRVFDVLSVIDKGEDALSDQHLGYPRKEIGSLAKAQSLKPFAIPEGRYAVVLRQP